MTESRADVPYGVLDLFVPKTLDAMGRSTGSGWRAGTSHRG